MEDKEIVELYFSRDERAIEETDKKYRNYFNRIAHNILFNEQDVLECLNDAYMKTWNSIPPNKPQKLSLYVGKIIRNLAFDGYRKGRAQKRGGSQISLVLDELEEILADTATVEGELEEKELINAINSFLKELPKEKRQLFVCRYWYGDSVKDIGARFQMPENKVSVTLKRVREKLWAYLNERGYV